MTLILLFAQIHTLNAYELERKVFNICVYYSKFIEVNGVMRYKSEKKNILIKTGNRAHLLTMSYGLKYLFLSVMG